MTVQYPPIVETAKHKAAQGDKELQAWIKSLNETDRNTLEPYMPVLRAIVKEVE